MATSRNRHIQNAFPGHPEAKKHGHAKQGGWIETVSEVKRRLKLCGTDAPLVILNLVYNIPCNEISELLKEHDVGKRIWRAINYISWGHDITRHELRGELIKNGVRNQEKS